MAPVELEKYLAVETAGGPSWHPREDRLAFVLNAPGTFQVHTVDVLRGHALWPERATHEKNRCTAPVFLSDGTVVFMTDSGGDENYQIGLIERSGKVSFLTHEPASKHLVSHVSPSSVYYQANVEDRARLDIHRWRIPLINNDPEVIYKPTAGLVSVSATLHNDRVLIIHRAIGNNEHEVLLYDDGSITSLTEGLVRNQKARWTPERFIDNNTLLVTTDFRSDFRRLALLTLSGEFRTIPEIEDNLRYETEEAAFAEGHAETYYLVNEEGYSRLYRAVFHADGMTDHEPIPLPINGTMVSGDARSFSRASSLSPDGSMLAITLASPVEPSNIWVLDTQDKTAWKATRSGLAGLVSSAFSDATLHRFSSFDGLSVPYFRYLPKGRKPERGWPFIVMIHGGPEAQIRPDFNPVIQFFVAAGYAVVTPNIRGSEGYGKKYLDLDNVEKRMDSIADIREMVMHIRNNDPSLDTTRAVVYGGSYGGFAVLSAMTEYPDLWKAGIDIVGISNFVTFLENTAPWRRALREAEYGSLEHDRDTLERISPIHKVDRIAAPLFIIQGDNDERVPLSESIQMYNRLIERGIPSRLLRFPDEGHGLARIENRIKAYTEVIDWLREIV
ncbi:MAG: S9 family peptidase [Candidatus Thorarchaeota archaeon]|nr:S9 family peptidase [Candidatus Thorarchaeota archaeon]